ncbi:uncharacterized protein METZ01_LOCUS455136, partial [marine metagenome]
MLVLINVSIWCCDFEYLEINGDCYFRKDIKFLQAFIESSQYGRNPPPDDLKPLNLGWQLWENGRLIEFCCSTSTNTECRMDYELSGNLPHEIGNLTELKIISLESNNIIGSLPPEIGNLGKLEQLKLSSNNMIGNIPQEIGKMVHLQTLALKGNNISGALPLSIIKLKD